MSEKAAHEVRKSEPRSSHFTEKLGTLEPSEPSIQQNSERVGTLVQVDCGTQTLESVPPASYRESRGKSPERARKYISVRVRREIFRRDQVCQFKNTQGELCGSPRHLTVDHVVPIWAGGGNDAANLRVLCGEHNLHRYQIGK